MPTTEVLKQLLDEFTEKEALIQEELKIINEQIDELNKRLGSCQRKLETIGADRDKVASMKEHYIGFSLKAADKISDRVAAKAAKKSKEKRLMDNVEKAPEPPMAAPSMEAVVTSQETHFFESTATVSSASGFNLIDVWQTQEEELANLTKEAETGSVTGGAPIRKNTEQNVPPPPLTREDKGSSEKKGSPPFQSLLDLSSSDGTEDDPSNIDKTLSEALKNLWSRDVPPQK